MLGALISWPEIPELVFALSVCPHDVASLGSRNLQGIRSAGDRQRGNRL